MSTEIKWLSKTRLKKNDNCISQTKNNCNLKLFEKSRHDFQKDLGQAKHLAQFRALSGKTQVRTLSDDTVRNRLTHSLEVADIATQIMSITDQFALKSLEGKSVERNKTSDLAIYTNTHEARSAIETICLLHDLGHPPFAHTGEKFLKNSKSLKV